jgi:hypothetical protein
MGWLTEAKERCEKATPPLWMEGDRHESMINIYAAGLHVNPVCTCRCPIIFDDKDMEANMQFITNARTDLPKALQLLERARELLVARRDCTQVFIMGITDTERQWLKELES